MHTYPLQYLFFLRIFFAWNGKPAPDMVESSDPVRSVVALTPSSHSDVHGSVVVSAVMDFSQSTPVL